MKNENLSNQALSNIIGGKSKHSAYYKSSYSAGKAYGALARDLIEATIGKLLPK